MRPYALLVVLLSAPAVLAQEAPAPDPSVVQQAQCNKQCRDLHAGAYEQARVQAAGEVETCSCVGPKGETLDVYQFTAGGLVDILAAATPTTTPKGENTIPVPSSGKVPLCPACYCDAGTNTDTSGIVTALYVLTAVVAVGIGVQWYYLSEAAP